jgi:hypothetical protein
MRLWEASGERWLTATDLLRLITAHYLDSAHFNGLPVHALADRDEVDELMSDASLFIARMLEPPKEPSEETVSAIRELVENGQATVVFGDAHPNPHIRALPDEPKGDTLAKLSGPNIGYACLYPTAQHLATVIEPKAYVGRPYALELALGGAQLEHRAFDLHVLEPYRNDPRFSYETNDISGQINVKSVDSGLKESEEVYLRFGFCYDNKDNRYVAVFRWDLFKLTPEVQATWRIREVHKETYLHPDYFRTAIMGDFCQHYSMYEAFGRELRTINRICAAIGRPNMFRHDYVDKRPRGFEALLRPTLKEFNDFTRLLDSMISDNINLKFFQDDISLERDVERKDGKIQVERKGSLSVLEEWIMSRFRPKDRTPMDDMFATFRQIRKLRNKPSHAPVEDEFSLEIAAQQRELMIKAYGAIRMLRLVLVNHPGAGAVKVDEHLADGQIWTI